MPYKPQILIICQKCKRITPPGDTCENCGAVLINPESHILKTITILKQKTEQLRVYISKRF
jgi:rRNA maturation endonuclease Nob1